MSHHLQIKERTVQNKVCPRWELNPWPSNYKAGMLLSRLVYSSEEQLLKFTNETGESMIPQWKHVESISSQLTTEVKQHSMYVIGMWMGDHLDNHKLLAIWRFRKRKFHICFSLLYSIQVLTSRVGLYLRRVLNAYLHISHLSVFDVDSHFSRQLVCTIASVPIHSHGDINFSQESSETVLLFLCYLFTLST